MQVVLGECEIHMNSLQQKVLDLGTCEDKIKTYLSERLKYHREVVNLHQLSLEIVQQIQPVFDELYTVVWEKEVVFLEKLLIEGQEKGEIVLEETRLVADSIISVSDGLKHEAIRNANTIFAADVDYSEIDKKITYVIGLIFRGLKA